MANQSNPNTPYDPDRLDNPTRTYIDDRRSPADLDSGLQPDPELAEGPASNTKVALFAVGIAIVLAAVFYGLNNSSMQHQASTVPAPVNSSTSPPAPPPGVRDVTPHSNSQPGTTTGAAPAGPQAPSPAPASK